MYRLSRAAVWKETRGCVWAAMEMMVNWHMESISSRQQSNGHDQQVEQRDEELVSQKGQVVE